MKTSFRRFTRFLLILIVVGTGIRLAAIASEESTLPAPVARTGRDARTPPPAGALPAALRVVSRAASGATIDFVTQNGQSTDGVAPQAMDLPHLVLTRNDALTDPDERTLVVEVSGLQVPPSGVTVVLDVTTQHGNPDTGSGARITVWRESRWVSSAQGATETGVTAVFRRVFTETVASETGMIPTPTDYFRYVVAVVETDHPTANPLHVFAEDYAFLMEDQWIVSLPEVLEQSPGAAPDELIVYTCDMLPFQRDAADRATRLPRVHIPNYVSAELLPAMVEAFRVQTDEWGFPWQQAWTSYRSGEDAGRLSVALTDGLVWYHGRTPSGGNSGISINVNGGDNALYDTLTEGVMGLFHHELFHNVQRGLHLGYGGTGSVDGADDAWQFFSEGTAVLASSVGQPAVSFSQTNGERYYVSNANSFLSHEWSAMRGSPYDTAIYWRFLYEQCGGMRDGVEDPRAGMQVIGGALAALYSGNTVDIGSSADVTGNVPRIVDQALANAPSCPFRTHEDSLTHFARAINALRLQGGRCAEPGIPAGCGLYDPNSLYRDPNISTLTYTGGVEADGLYNVARRKHSASIPTSFGMDFVDVHLDPVTDGQPLTLEFYGTPGADAAFDVQVWQLFDSGSGARPQRIPAQLEAPEVLGRVRGDDHLFYTLPAIDTSQVNRLALIITRVDAHESSDPFGRYTVRLHPNAGGSAPTETG